MLDKENNDKTKLLRLELLTHILLQSSFPLKVNVDSWPHQVGVLLRTEGEVGFFDEGMGCVVDGVIWTEGEDG